MLFNVTLYSVPVFTNHCMLTHWFFKAHLPSTFSHGHMDNLREKTAE